MASAQHWSIRAARNLAHAVNKPRNLFICGIAGRACAHQPFFAEAESLNYGRGVEVSVRCKDSAFDQSATDFG
jgi:hypothetical protein